MLAKFKGPDSNAVRNPLVIIQDLMPEDTNEALDNKRPYRELIGSLLYVAQVTRPDISIALSLLLQNPDRPTSAHWRVQARIYKSKRQSTVALSSAEAEYTALALTVQEVLWIRYLLVEIGLKTTSRTTILVENTSAILFASNQG
ncbi:hypothetical protein PsorP6_013763 [Peronosclerospora sorghi]|uniref:Uncharacterized protein n=1 Tax=Peronosclerospora sorghi TaxID=230839 RepID=A0ACC0VGW4_9STRA|nr:hypothetical protein PsorP6_013763 [Peronosclerospora sorghi]